VDTGTNPTPGFADGLQAQKVLAAVERSSADSGCWVTLDRL
jgi:hypothetical protein